MEYNDFSEHPVTIGELRSEQPNSGGSDWSPRDVLISVLRDLDSGLIEPKALLVAYTDFKKTSFTQSSPNIITLLGLITHVAYVIHDATEEE